MGPDFGGGMGNFETMFQLVSTLIIIGFVVVIGSIVLGVVKKATQAAKDSASPEVSAAATIVDKRVEVSGGGTTSSPGMLTADGAFGPSTSTSTPISRAHYVTFEQSGGERFELQVPENEYGLLVVGDNGSVTMKGSRYLGFTREILR